MRFSCRWNTRKLLSWSCIAAGMAIAYACPETGRRTVRPQPHDRLTPWLKRGGCTVAALIRAREETFLTFPLCCLDE